MKKILLFFPENPLKMDSGNKTRVVELLKYYQLRGFEVDFVSMLDKDFTTDDVLKLEQTGWIKKGYLIRRKPKKGNFFSYLFNFKIPSLFYNRSKVLNFVTYNLKKEFDAILQQNSYDFIIISYVGWANLIEGKAYLKNARTIIDTHDFASVQAKGQKQFAVGKYFEDEINKLNRFDEVWAISGDEFFVFNQFVADHVTVRLMPFLLPNNFDKANTEKVFDLIYVASDNAHNTKSAQWFFEHVYPMLDKNLRICIIGKIGNCIGDYPNVTKLRYVENLTDSYAQSRIALCPMLSGSGLKIKVIEALSFGIPIVTNTHGVDGLSNKTNNGCLVTDDAGEFATYITQLANDASFFNTLQSQAKSFYSGHYDVSENYKKWDAIYAVK